jgi:small redox-active disulfide protein 2
MKQTIEVIGSGCPTCKKFHDIVARVVAEMGGDFTVEYSTDVQRIVQLGLMQSPVLVVNGRPAIVGFISNKEEIKEAIQNNL